MSIETKIDIVIVTGATLLTMGLAYMTFALVFCF